MPMPSTTNTPSIIATPPASAKPSAAPMNGAVHGEATTTARTPEPNASIVRLLLDHSATPDGASWPNSNTPDRFKREHEEEDRQRRHDRRRLQLEPPAELFARGAQRRQQHSQRNERKNDAGRECNGLVMQRRLSIVMRREAQHLEREHREYARHQVEQQAADERGRERNRQRKSADLGRRREIQVRAAAEVPLAPAR